MVWEVIVSFLKPDGEEWQRNKEEHGDKEYSSTDHPKTLRTAMETDEQR